MGIERVALMVSGFEGGGVERNFTHLALGLDQLNIETTLMVGAPEHPFVQELADSGVCLLPARGDREMALLRLIEQRHPDLLMTGKLVDDFAAIAARDRLSHTASHTPLLVAAVGTLLSGRFTTHPWNLFKRLRDIRRIRDQYRHLDGITAISAGVADDIRQVFCVHGIPIRVLNNPIIPDDADARSTAPCPHPWLADVRAGIPVQMRPAVIIAVGGLRRVKGFDTLIKAFARLQDNTTRLLILGEGKERAALQNLAWRLGVADRVSLHGFVPNPYPFIARARLLVLSSIREGLGNVVIEALALGTPVVATNCSHGLRELSRRGTLGPLVPPKNPATLAGAIDDAMVRSPAPEALSTLTESFCIEASARAHLDFFQSLTRP